jgi:hypothetical protein
MEREISRYLVAIAETIKVGHDIDDSSVMLMSAP